MPVRRAGLIQALVLLAAVPAAGAAHAAAEVTVQRMTAEFSYALRNRLEDRDGFWFATYELRGHAFPNDRAERSFALACIGAAWGFDHRLGGEEGVCRLSDGADVLFARLRAAEGDVGEVSLAFEIHGGRGAYGGKVGQASGLRAMDLSGERPTGRGSMMLRLALHPAPNGAE
jgi:hypothetical protein